MTKLCNSFFSAIAALVFVALSLLLFPATADAVVAVFTGASGSGVIVAVVGSGPQTTERVATLAGPSTLPASTAFSWVSCDDGWAYITLTAPTTCGLDSPGGWCRDAYIVHNRSTPGETECTINAPGAVEYDSEGGGPYSQITIDLVLVED